eukprot:TRINITY_DN21681_c0_g1_i1.p2 TRINITY_DN21681_c0_g1~~TRINITY_DN21681_c0_g1_i1.p2  ORF type:complete len:261 (+),score=66.52 TRINITY_DN21681_c0_g1_i1:86-784(+)
MQGASDKGTRAAAAAPGAAAAAGPAAPRRSRKVRFPNRSRRFGGPERILQDEGLSASKALGTLLRVCNSSEAMVGLFAASGMGYLAWKSSKQSAEDKQRRQWVRDQGLTYGDIMRTVADGDDRWSNPPEMQLHSVVRALAELTAPASRGAGTVQVGAGRCGIITQMPTAPDQPPEVRFPGTLPFKPSRRASLQPVQYLIDQWGWRPEDGEGAPIDTDSDDDAGSAEAAALPS